MSDPAGRCARCGEELPSRARSCPACGTPVPGASPASASATGPRTGAATAAPELPREMAEQLERLRSWAEPAQSMGISLPQLPSWAESAIRSGEEADEWAEVLRGIERISQQRIVGALEAWERDTRNRLHRLEAYAVDGRLEREQIEDVLHAARAGDLAAAIAQYRQVDKVLTLKERHLDQAREELERIVSLLRDMRALGIPTAQDPAAVAEDLESELRSGRLASLKQRLRGLRSEAVGGLEEGLRTYIRAYGERLLAERAHGASVELEASELARSAREFARGHPEEALRRLRVLSQVHAGGSAEAPKDAIAPGATEVSRTA